MAESDAQTPQFTTAEYAAGPTGMACGVCRQRIQGQYFQVRGAPICAGCAQKIRAGTPVDSQAAFGRAVLFGIGGAIAGFVLYVGFAMATGLVAGIVSLAVGYLVGKAMQRGSGGVGGRRYQIAAVALTYLAVSLSAVPIAVQQHVQNLATLALLGIASPLLALQDPAHGLIGLVILFVGIRFAWRLTADRSVTVSGPYAPAAGAA